MREALVRIPVARRVVVTLHDLHGAHRIAHEADVAIEESTSGAGATSG